MCHNVTMLPGNLRQLRDTRRLKAWLRTGNTVELRERDRVIARIVPEKAEENRESGQISRPAPEKYWETLFSRTSSLRIGDVIERLRRFQLMGPRDRAIDMCHNM
jgi:hypothetical protein